MNHAPSSGAVSAAPNPDQIRASIAVQAPPPADLFGDLERVREALSYIPPDDRETWVRMAFAVKSELGEAGRDIWDAWSQRADNYNAADARDVWKSSSATGGIKGGTLFHEARLNGWRETEPPVPSSPAELAERQRQADEQAAKDAAEVERQQAETAHHAALIWEQATSADGHPYLRRKGVEATETLRQIDVETVAALIGYRPQAGGERLTGPLLVAPITRDGQMVSLELIDGDGRKAALKGKGTKTGGFWLAQPMPEGDGEGAAILVAEGVATALSAREATGHPVVAALSLSNFAKVLKALRARYPKATLMVLADVDKTTGRPDSKFFGPLKETAIACGALLTAPDFGTNRPEGATDFNDLHQAHGLEAVRAQIQETIEPAEPEDDAQPDPETTPATDIVEAAITRQPKDPGAVFEPDVINAWAQVQGSQMDAYQRLRAKAKQAGASVSAIDAAVKAAVKAYMRESRNARAYSDRYTSDPYEQRAESTHLPSDDPPKSDGLPSGSLLYWTEDDKRARLIESLAAEQIASAMRGRLAWDSEAGTWRVWAETHWEVLSQPAKADATLADAVHVGTHPLGYRLAYLNGVVQIIQRRGLLAPPKCPANVIPFRNGLLDIDTHALERATPGRALDWVLPHDYTPEADCPAIKAWLLRSVEGDQETVQLLRAWMAALIRGIPLQKFLLLLGPGGSGKGTYQNLVTALIGAHNIATSALRDLEENRFETAKLYGRRLCMINEAGKHGGSLNMLKAITGGDHVPLERKHVQQSGSFVFDGLVLMATNEDLQSTDSTSGLERRRITVRFPVAASDEEIADWDAKGGAEAVLHPEIPGLINWLLRMPVAEILTRIKNPPHRVVTDNLLGMAAGNSVADWLLQKTIPTPGAWTQIGVKIETRDLHSGKTAFEKEDRWLYPNYLKWCLESGRSRPVALRKFKDTVVDIAKTLKHPVADRQDGKTRASGIDGLRLARVDEPSGPEVWRGDDRRDKASNCRGRRDNDQNFIPENPAKHNNDGGMGIVEGEV